MCLETTRLETQRRPQAEVDAGYARILRHDERPLFILEPEVMALDRQVASNPQIEPAHASRRNELESCADVPGIGQ